MYTGAELLLDVDLETELLRLALLLVGLLVPIPLRTVPVLLPIFACADGLVEPEERTTLLSVLARSP